MPVKGKIFQSVQAAEEDAAARNRTSGRLPKELVLSRHPSTMLDNTDGNGSNEIAIVGFALRVPGDGSVDELCDDHEAKGTGVGRGVGVA